MAFFAFHSVGANAKTHRLEKGLHVAKHCISDRQDVVTMWLKYGVGRENHPHPGLITRPDRLATIC